jgi:hypothetical protein
MWIAVQMLGRTFTYTIATVLKSLACAMLVAQPSWTIGGTWQLARQLSQLTGPLAPTELI